jgi:hypothetical protein
MEVIMGLKEKLWIASIAIGKHYDFEQLKYSDYLYGKESMADEVWDFVEECEDIGITKFKEKYKEYKLYI